MFDHRDYDFFVDENLPAGQIVGTVQATDLDPTVPNNKLTYAIVPDDGTFSVDPGSGLITTKRPLDRETKDLHELIAHVFDHGRERSRLVPSSYFEFALCCSSISFDNIYETSVNVAGFYAIAYFSRVHATV